MKTSVRGATHAWESTVGAAARDRNNNFVFYLKLLSPAVPAVSDAFRRHSTAAAVLIM